MQRKLGSDGRRMVTIIDPHIKRDDNYYIHKEATALGLYIKDKNADKDFDGDPIRVKPVSEDEDLSTIVIEEEEDS